MASIRIEEAANTSLPTPTSKKVSHWVRMPMVSGSNPATSMSSGGFSVILKGLPGAMRGTHYHVGTVVVTRCAVTGGTWSTMGRKAGNIHL